MNEGVLSMSIEKAVDRFSLENDILLCWRIIDDLNTLRNVYDREHTEDEVLNILIGLSDLYDQRFTDLFDTFEKCIKAGVVT